MRLKVEIGIIDADLLDNGTRHPNLALMKLSAFYKENGNNVNLIKNYSEIDNFDQLFLSKVFSFTNVPEYVLNKKNIKLGGTGFFLDGGENLPLEIEHHKPDYNLYTDYVTQQINLGYSKNRFSDYLDYSIGFSTRGCFRKCDFCVNKKYDKPFKHSPISEFFDIERPYIYLWDDNFLAFKDWEDILDELEETNKPFQFRQGLDIRLLSSQSAKRLSQTKYHGDFIFAFDHIEDRELIQNKLKLWKRYCNKTTKLYVLCSFVSQDESDRCNTCERIKILMQYGCLPYIMRHENNKKSKYRSLYVQIARWCNQPQFLKKMSFREFCIANQNYHKNKETFCSAYQGLIDFEKEHPDISEKYFDLKFEYENEYFYPLGYGRKYSHKKDCNICIRDQKTWNDFYLEHISFKETLPLYYAKEIDLACLTYKNVFCPDNLTDKIGKWFCNSLLATDWNIILSSIINNNNLEEISLSNIPQFSKLYDAIINTVKILKASEEELSFDDLGYYLDGKEKNKAARLKYGENHSKLACLLDLLVITNPNNKYRMKLSILGNAYCNLDEEKQKYLAAKLMIRIPIIQKIIKDASINKVSIDNYLNILSNKTHIRRRNNLLDLLKFIKSHANGNIIHIFENIIEMDETKCLLSI